MRQQFNKGEPNLVRKILCQMRRGRRVEQLTDSIAQRNLFFPLVDPLTRYFLLSLFSYQIPQTIKATKIPRITPPTT